MKLPDQSEIKVAVLGLGYVGLPLALALAKNFKVIGYDVNETRITELRSGNDRTNETILQSLDSRNLTFETNKKNLASCNVFIVTVPTPVDHINEPDLSALKEACSTIGIVMKPGSIVVFESTVYPGVTEDICGAELEKHSGLKCGHEFYLGYSPERINPGDNVHTLEKITKIVAGQSPKVTDFLAAFYRSAVPAGVYIAENIRTAEAAKVIENTQRDINIAFINEATMIFQKLGVNIHDALAAARTKWNFLDFQPGLVGGHCIGVDPYYLAYAAKAAGHKPEIVLSGRRINDHMADFIAKEINTRLPHPAKTLILGLTFKENVSDLRNSKVANLVYALREYGHKVDVHDPLANPAEAMEQYGIEMLATLDRAEPYDVVVGAVAHNPYKKWKSATLQKLLVLDGLLCDLKGIWPQLKFKPPTRIWRL